MTTYMKFRQIFFRFQQFGGFRMLMEYVRLGVLSEVGKGLFKGKSFIIIYYDVLHKLEPILKEKYMPVLQERKAYYQNQQLEHNRSKIVWFCWLQGLEQAPSIVKACYNSLLLNLSDREIRIITKENWKEYIELPDYIKARWNKGEMSPAHFSDLLRLQLLIRYGGTWIDSTVLCTGTNHVSEYLDTDLFLFQYTPPENYPQDFNGISNWFITSCSNNEILIILRDMLYAYWKDYGCTLDYYIFHYFFSLLRKEYPDVISKMPYGYSVWSITLVEHWNESFSQKKWNRLTSIVDFHKLAYTIDNKVKEDKSNFYNWILKKYN